MSEIQFLETCQLALTNAENQPDVAKYMSEMGYDAAKLAEGRALYVETKGVYEANKKEHQDESVAYSDFDQKVKKLLQDYTLLRKKAKVVFRKEPLVLSRLKLDGTMPVAYVNKIDVIRTFATVMLADSALQAEMNRLKVKSDDIETLNAQLALVDQARAKYHQEKGESQNMTSIKDKAFAKLDDWMNEFYAVARIALEDQPQLLEALGKVIR